MSDVTHILMQIESGDPVAAEQLLPLVYDELRKLAAAMLAQEKPGQTLQPTALVHEAYLRLIGSSPSGGDTAHWDGRAHFFGAASEAMRRILIDAARRKKRDKHGGSFQRQPLDPDQIAIPECSDELLALNEALTKLAQSEPEIAQLVTLRYFGGLTLQEAATVMGFTSRTASSYWAYARVWIQAELTRAEHAEPD